MTEVYAAAISLPDDQPVTDIETANRIADSFGLGDRAVEPADPDAWDVGVWNIDLTPDLQAKFEREGGLYLTGPTGSIVVESY